MCFGLQSSEKKAELAEAEGQTEGQCDTTDSPAKQAQASSEGGGTEQPFIKLSQEEYGEHHSSIMHCRRVDIQRLNVKFLGTLEQNLDLRLVNKIYACMHCLAKVYPSAL